MKALPWVSGHLSLLGLSCVTAVANVFLLMCFRWRADPNTMAESKCHVPSVFGLLFSNRVKETFYLHYDWLAWVSRLKVYTKVTLGQLLLTATGFNN